MFLATLARNFIVVLVGRLGLYKARNSAYAYIICNLVEKLIDQACEKPMMMDVGAGRGQISRLVGSMLKAHVVAIDINSGFLKSSGRSLNPVVCDAHSLPFKSSSFDIVLLISLLEHLTEPSLCLCEVARILKVNGLCVLQLPNLQWFVEPHTKWPLLHFMPSFLSHIIARSTGYKELNLNVTIKNVLAKFGMAKLINVARAKIYGFSILKLLPWPPAWFLVFRRNLA